jgi:hypothetical protein
MAHEYMGLQPKLSELDRIWLSRVDAYCHYLRAVQSII